MAAAGQAPGDGRGVPGPAVLHLRLVLGAAAVAEQPPGGVRPGPALVALAHTQHCAVLHRHVIDRGYQSCCPLSTDSVYGDSNA